MKKKSSYWALSLDLIYNDALSMWNINPVFTFHKALPYLHITHSEHSPKQDLKQGLGMWKLFKTQI